MATSPEGIKFFSDPTRIVMYPIVAAVPAPKTWKTIMWHKYASFAKFQSDITNGAVPVGTKVIGYDDEAWSFTPANEQSDPIGYTIKFAKLAHAHGYKVISMPAENIIPAHGQDKFTVFANYGMAKAVGPYVDYYHIQSQDLVQTPATYVSYMRTIISQVHATSPNVIITGGVSTNSRDQNNLITGTEIDTAINASTRMVSGYWLNIVGATTPIAVDALTNL